MSTQATGDTSLIPWLTGYFYIYYPIIIVLVCLATLLSLGTRLASLLGYEKFIGEDDFSADYIDEGKALMKRGVSILLSQSPLLIMQRIRFCMYAWRTWNS